MKIGDKVCYTVEYIDLIGSNISDLTQRDILSNSVFEIKGIEFHNTMKKICGKWTITNNIVELVRLSNGLLINPYWLRLSHLV